MSTVASPHPPSAKGPRRPGKKHQPANHPDGSISDVGVPTQHQRNNSPSVGNQTRNNNKGHNRKPSHANNRPQPESSTSERAKSGNYQYENTKGTPIKPAAYAGSTFQQSPAASALPLPSFYSKSLPAAASSLPPQASNSEVIDSRTSSITSTDHSPSKRETTPCDFLFEAARQAKSTPRAASPATRSGNLSVPNGSPASRSPAPREGDPMFPFELEGGAVPGENGSSFATPYKDRMEALRSTHSPASGSKGMDELERKAKSDALKKLLMNSSGHDASNNGSLGPDMNNPFNARAPYQQPAFFPQGAPPIRHPSAPSPTYTQEQNGYKTSQNMPQKAYPFPPAQVHTPKRPTSSRLRNVYEAQSEPEYAELSSDNAVTPPMPTSRKHVTHQAPQSIPHHNGPTYPAQQQMPGHAMKPSAQQLEDDLRRVLKLDLTSRG